MMIRYLAVVALMDGEADIAFEVVRLKLTLCQAAFTRISRADIEHGILPFCFYSAFQREPDIIILVYKEEF
jgi:hypothetical protein